MSSATVTDIAGFSLKDILEKFDRLEDALNEEIKERPEQNRGLVRALASGTHIFLRGEPGIGKTLSAERLMLRIHDAQLFKTQVGPLSPLEQVLGPLDVPAMLDSRYRRHNDLYLPKSHVGLIDEGFDAGPALLVGLNRLMNEGEYEDDGRMKKAETSTVIVCSNEYPGSSRLRAFYDRLLQRFEIIDILETQTFIDAVRDELDPEPELLLTWAEIDFVKRAVSAMPVPDAVWTKLGHLRRRLTEELHHTPSTRRFKQSMLLARAEALLDGASAVAVEHLQVMADTLWDSKEQIEAVQKIVLELADPVQQQLNKLIRDIDGLSPELDRAIDLPDETPAQHEQRENACMDVFDKVKRANQALQGVRAQAGDGRRQGHLVDYAREKLHKTVVRLMMDGLGQTEEQIAALDLGLA